MTVIYATKKLEDIHARVVQDNPTVDCVLLCNGPMAYAWGSSARLVCKGMGWRPKKSVVISRDSIERLTTALNDAGKAVGVADLDATT